MTSSPITPLEELRKRTTEPKEIISAYAQKCSTTDEGNLYFAATQLESTLDEALLEIEKRDAEIEKWKKELERVDEFSREEGARLFDANARIKELEKQVSEAHSELAEQSKLIDEARTVAAEISKVKYGLQGYLEEDDDKGAYQYMANLAFGYEALARAFLAKLDGVSYD